MPVAVYFRHHAENINMVQLHIDHPLTVAHIGITAKVFSLPYTAIGTQKATTTHGQQWLSFHLGRVRGWARSVGLE
jgi:hypothetical protein